MPENPALESPGKPIAIVGMACRFPDAAGPAEFLELVVTGRRAFRRLPPVRIDVAEYSEAEAEDPSVRSMAPGVIASARAGLVEGWRFDRAAFGITEAAYRAADPAHWLALETATRALADGGFPGGQGLTRDRTGVIIGNTLTGEVSRATAMRSRWPFVRRVLREALAAGEVSPERHAEVIEHAAAGFLDPFPEISDDTLAGSLPGAIADRICGHFGFRGGGHAVDAAHSSSLLAVASACSALAAGDVDTAVAGGVDISMDPFELTGLAATGALASDEMRVYDARPTGFWPGEGCGLVILMRAADARAAGIPAYAEIAGWGVSSAGNPALTRPGSASLLLALRRAYQRASIDPVDVQLIEGDGTGTASGDLAELTSLAEIRQGSAGLAALGSVKANIGHTKAAAGAAGLIKATLSIAAGVIPPATGCVRPHPLIASEDARMRAPRGAQPWPGRERLAGVSSVGPGGTSVHVILRRAGDSRRRRAPGASQLRWGFGASQHQPLAVTGASATMGATSSPTGPSRTGASSRGATEAAAVTATEGNRADGAVLAGGTHAGDAGHVPARTARSGETPAIPHAAVRPGETPARPHAAARPGEATTDAMGPGPAGAGTTDLGGGGEAPPGIPITAVSAPRTEAFAFSAGDRLALARELNRVADLAPWMSDGEFHDLACQAGRASDPGPVRAGLVASSVDQLARLAREAAALVPGLRPGKLASVPGVFAADGGHGRVVLLFPGEGSAMAGQEFPPRLTETGTYDPALQPAIAAASLAGLRWLNRLGLAAAAGIGHGLGEITGLVWAGCLSEQDTVRLVAQRAALLAAPSAERTAMVCVDADEDTARALCAGSGLVIAAYNGPRGHVLAGPAALVRDLARRLTDDGVPARLLDSPHGFYSPAMADRVAPLRSILRDFSFRPPARRLISTISGAELTAADDIASMLCAQLTSPIIFAGPLSRASEDADLLVETGPGQRLARLATDCCEVPAVSLAGGRADDAAIAEVAAALFAAGAVAGLAPLFAARAARPIDIWRERLFIPSPCGSAPPRGTQAAHGPGQPHPSAQPSAGQRPAGQPPAMMSGSPPAPPPGSTMMAGRDIAPAAATPAATPGIDGPSGSAPNPLSASPGTAVSGTATPGTATPGTATPGTATPGTATPGTAASGTADTRPAAPGTATTGPADTGADAAGTGSGLPILAADAAGTAPGRPAVGTTSGGTAGTAAGAGKETPVTTAAGAATGTASAAAPAGGTTAAKADMGAQDPAGAGTGAGTGLPTQAAAGTAEEDAAVTTATDGSAARTAAPAGTAGETTASRTGASIATPDAAGIPATGTPATGIAATGIAAPGAGTGTPTLTAAWTPAAGTGADVPAPAATGTPAAGTGAGMPVLAAAAATTGGTAADAGTGTASCRGAAGVPPVAHPKRDDGAPAQRNVLPDAGMANGPRARFPGPRRPIPAAGGPALADSVPGRQDPGVRGVGPWVHCFTEGRRPAEPPGSPGAPGPWRVRTATGLPFGRIASRVFRDDPAAGTVLALIGDPAEPGSCATLLGAAREAAGTGHLVVITSVTGLTGFCASLQAEHAGLGVTLIRAALTPDGLRAARPFAATISGQFREVVLDESGTASEPVMMTADPAADGTFPLGPADVVLVSGITRAGDLACATALAGRGAALAVIAQPGPEDPRLAACLAELRAAGARVSRKKADLTDPGQVAAAVRSLERGLGPVTAVVHAAAAGPLERCTRLSEPGLRSFLASQRARLSNVLNAIAMERLRVLVTFGSAAARYGHPRAGCDALAGGLLAEHASRLAGGGPRCRVLHVDWAPWAEFGPAGTVSPRAERSTERHGTGQPADPVTHPPAIEPPASQAGVMPISVSEGSRLLLAMLTTPDLPGRVAVHGRLGLATPTALRTGEPGLAIRGRFLDPVRVHYPDVELVTDCRISLRADPYLADYRIDGLAVLPPAMALEAMAQAAAAVAGRPLRLATDVSMAVPVVIPAGSGIPRDDDGPAGQNQVTGPAASEGGPAAGAAGAGPTGAASTAGPGGEHVRAGLAAGEAVLRVCALRRGDEVETVIRCSETGFRVNHARAVFRASRPPTAAREPASPPEHRAAAVGLPTVGIVDGTDLYGPVYFQLGRFRRVAFLPEVSSRACRALVRGGDDQPWFGAIPGPVDIPLVLGSPGLNDATLQLVQACQPHRRLFLAGCESATFAGHEVRGALRVQARQRPGSTSTGTGTGTCGVWDVVAMDATGQPIATWTGAQFRNVGPLAQTGAWHPTLLANSLEARATGLGLDPSLRATISSGLSPQARNHPVATSPAHPSSGMGTAASPGTTASPGTAASPGEAASAGWSDTAPGHGPLDGFELRVAAAGPVACRWEAVCSTQNGDSPLDQDLAKLRQQLDTRPGESQAAALARFRTIASCLSALDRAPGTPCAVEDAHDGGWIVVWAHGIVVASAVIEISGVPAPVAMAIATRLTPAAAGHGASPQPSGYGQHTAARGPVP